MILFVQKVLRLVNFGGQVGTSSTVRVVQNHHFFVRVSNLE